MCRPVGLIRNLIYTEARLGIWFVEGSGRPAPTPTSTSITTGSTDNCLDLGTSIEYNNSKYVADRYSATGDPAENTLRFFLALHRGPYLWNRRLRLSGKRE